MRFGHKSNFASLRYRADMRTLVWAFLLFPATAFAPYVEPRLVPWLLPWSLYLGFCAAVFSHNHNHCPVFKSRALNSLFSAWLSVFYAFPTFAWIPTHNLNHHKYVNKEGDATITWRYSKKNNWLVASTYYFVSAYWQKPLIDEYTRKARESSPRLYRQIVAQRVAVFGGHAALLAVALLARGPRTGAVAYAFGFLFPALFATWSMMFINYIQHVHCDPWSEHDHSRNFVSRLGNWLVFNSGYHTAHHESAGLHWSCLPEAHAKIADRIRPELNQTSIFGYCVRAYLLGAIFDRFRTEETHRGASPTSTDTASAA
jgi:fatty acid desaturase